MTVRDDKLIILATDFSAPAERAYAYAAKLTAAFGTRLIILNVLEGPPGLDREIPVNLNREFPVNAIFLKQLQEESDRELSKLVRIAEKDGIAHETRRVYGTSAGCIDKAAEEALATLIVLGTHGRTGWDRLLLGSTAEAVVREAPCPVLTVRMVRQEQADPMDRLLVPMDFSECAQEAFEYAFILARQLGAKVRLVHAMEAAAYPLDFSLMHVTDEKALRSRILQRLDELVVVLKAEGVDADRVCEMGAPTEVILRQAQEERVGAIVMGTHGRRGLSHLALGSVAEYVVRHAACPVFTVKCPKYRHRIEREVRDAKQYA